MRDLICERDYLSESESWWILNQALAALLHLHSLRIVHRDIKLDNILIGDTDHASGILMAPVRHKPPSHIRMDIIVTAHFKHTSRLKFAILVLLVNCPRPMREKRARRQMHCSPTAVAHYATLRLK